MAAGQGKFVVGVQDVPNLSVLTALGRNETHPQVAPSAVPEVLENKTYVVVAVPDGDNLDFAAGLMRDRWSESVRDDAARMEPEPAFRGPRAPAARYVL